MTKKEIIKNIAKRINEIKDAYPEYDRIGIRVQENEFKKGEILNNSYIWIDGEMTDDELDGTCAVNLDDAELAKGYYGDHIALIAGDYTEWGQDLGEIIITNAQVLEVLA